MNLCKIKLSELERKTEINTISNDLNDFISILILPFFENNNGNVVNQKFYIYSEKHHELSNRLEWLSPELINTLDSQVAVRIPIWKSKHLLEKWLGRHVLPLDGKYPGIIISFKHRQRKKIKTHAIWTVKYTDTNDDERSGRAYKRVEYLYNQILDILM